MVYHVQLFDTENAAIEINLIYDSLRELLMGHDSNSFRFFSAEYGLGLREYLLFTSSHTEYAINDLMERKGLIKTNEIDFTLEDRESSSDWIFRENTMFHIENFNSSVPREKTWSFFIDTAFPFLRSINFDVSLFESFDSNEVKEFWFATRIDSFSSIDKWTHIMDTREGKNIMTELIEIVDTPRGNIYKNLFSTTQ